MKNNQKSNCWSLLDAVKEIFGRPSRRQYRAREARFERELIDLFSGAGAPVRWQVDCGDAGRADVVTDDAIYELKVVLNRRTRHEAMGQLLSYRQHLNPSARMVIACLHSKVEHLHEKTRRLGFDIMLCNPPYFTREDH